MCPENTGLCSKRCGVCFLYSNSLSVVHDHFEELQVENQRLKAGMQHGILHWILN
jgi:hypothetical protein